MEESALRTNGELWTEKMLNESLGYNAIGVVNTTEIRGGVTATKVERSLRVGKGRKSLRRLARYSLVGVAIALLPLPQAVANDEVHRQFVPIQSSTVPSNGDLNPYGVAVVPDDFPGGGPLQPGDILVSNFNNSANLQGTGTTIVKVAPNGQTSLFFQGNPQGNPPPTLGLTTALGVLKLGFVLVGNVPTTDGTVTTIQAGSLLVLDRKGVRIATISDPAMLNGPWDLTIFDGGGSAAVFVSNVLSGTVTRLDLDVNPSGVSVTRKIQIASGYTHHSDSAALVVGPTGLAYDVENDVLYVASTGDNEIFRVQNAGKTIKPQDDPGTVIYHDNAHLRGPLGLVFAPNGHLLASNGDAPSVSPPSTQSLNSEIVEFTNHGEFIGEFSIDSAAGGAFGIAILPTGRDSVGLAAVDDSRNDITVFKLSTQ